MNRENRRSLKKMLNNKSFRTKSANYLESLGDKINDVIADGDSVVLNTNQIMGRKDYTRKQESYRSFVEQSQGKIFVAHPYRKNPDGFSALYELDGVDRWLFWYGDLMKVENNQAEVGE